MRIGVDGRELAGARTGVGRYVSQLCRAWRADPAAAGHEILVYVPAEAGEAAPAAEAARDGAPGADAGAGARIAVRPVPGAPGLWWEQTALARAANADGLDVFFGPGYSIPLRLRAPAVVTLHDISFVVHPEWFAWREGLRRRWLARLAAARAARVLTVSACARDEIVRELDLDPQRVAFVHNGIEAPGPGPAAPGPAAPGPDAGAGRRRDGPPRVLYVGARFNRRRLPTLIDAFARVVRQRPDARLTIAGADRTRPAQDLAACAEAAGVAGRVDLSGHVPDAEIAALLARAHVFAFLSEYEGFGMTPLEALAAGVPAVVGDTPVAREVCGDAVRFAPVDDPPAVAREILRLLDDEPLRAALLARGAARLRRFTWRRAAAATLAVIEQAAAAPH